MGSICIGRSLHKTKSALHWDTPRAIERHIRDNPYCEVSILLIFAFNKRQHKAPYALQTETETEMKKSIALLALASLFIGMTSCNKKDEPKPVAPVLPNTIDASADAATIKNAQAVLAVPANSIVYISPKKGLHILGATMDTSDSTKFTVGPSGLLGINGSTSILSIKSDEATEITLAKTLSSLKRLILTTTKDSRRASASQTTIDLSGVSELEGLFVAGYTVDVLDLTKQKKLKYLALGGFNWSRYFPEMTTFLGYSKEKDTDITEVKLPTNNVIEYIAGRSQTLVDGKFDVDNLPKLKKFFWQSPYFKNFTFAKSQDLEILYTISPTKGIHLNADLGNKPKLQDITFRNTTLSKLAISNATASTLLDDSKDRISAITIEFDNINPEQAVSFIKRTAIKKEENKPDLPVTKSILLKNMTLTEAQILDLISGLGATNGTLKVKADLLTTAVKAALTAKGWTGAAL